MNIRKLYYYHKKFGYLKAWYFLAAALVFALLAVQGLRSNYAQMVELRSAVYAADEANGDVEGALQRLRQHVHGHMNTDLASGNNAIRPPIHLKARYERLVAAEQERIKAANAGVTARAEAQCAQQFPGEGFNAPRVDCIQKAVAASAAKPQAIPDELYKFDFISPRWSPDLAGFSIILSLIFFALFLSRIALEKWMQRNLE